MLQLLAHARHGSHSGATLSAAAAVRAQSRSLWTARSALSRVHAASSLSAAAAPAAAHAAASSARMMPRLMPLHATRLPQRSFATEAPADGDAADADADAGGEDAAVADAAAGQDEDIASDEQDDGFEPPEGPNIPLYLVHNATRNIDDYADEMAAGEFEEVNSGLESDPDAERYAGGEAASYAIDIERAERARVEAELSGVRGSMSEEEFEEAVEERLDAQRAEEMEQTSPEHSDREQELIENTDEIEEEQESEMDPTHIADNKWVFERQEINREGKLVKVFVDKMGKKLRHMDDYVADGDVDPEETEFMGFDMRYRKAEMDPLADDIDESHDPIMGDPMRVEEDDEEDDEQLEEQDSDLDYNDEMDPAENWEVEGPLHTRNPVDEEEQVIYGLSDDPSSDAKVAYRVGGPQMPVTEWQGRRWLSFPRTWENIKLNGRYPSEEEVEAHIKEILGTPRPDIPVNPELPSKPQEYIWAPNLGEKHMDTSLLMTETEWKKKNTAERASRTWFTEARIQYRRKLHLVRAKYMAEYKHVKSLHDANIQARWDQQMENRRARLELAQRKQIVHQQHALEFHARALERRRRQRIKRRYTRLNKDMKERRHKLHMINYMLKERERHWIHPTFNAATGTFAANKNLTPKIFDTQSEVEGFWPKPREIERMEKNAEFARRKQAKNDA